MRKIKDRVTLGVVAGLAGAVVKSGLNLLALRFGLTRADYAKSAGSFFTTRKQARTGWEQVAGRITDLIIGGFFGVGTTYALTYTGKDNHLLKGVLMSNGLWAGSYGVLWALGLKSRRVMNARTALLGLVEFTAMGLTTSAVINALGDDSLFPQKDFKVPGPEEAPYPYTEQPTEVRV